MPKDVVEPTGQRPVCIGWRVPGALNTVAAPQRGTTDSDIM